jgi:hypothetical protein
MKPNLSIPEAQTECPICALIERYEAFLDLHDIGHLDGDLYATGLDILGAIDCAHQEDGRVPTALLDEAVEFARRYMAAAQRGFIPEVDT